MRPVWNVSLGSAEVRGGRRRAWGEGDSRVGRLKLTVLGPLLEWLLPGSLCLFGIAVIQDEPYLAVIGGVLLIAGISAHHRRQRNAERSLAEDIRAEAAPRQLRRGALESAPKLGELLAYRYHCVGEQDLARARAVQKRTGKPLGEVLIRLRLVSPEQVAQVLREHPGLQDGPSLGRISESWTGRRREPS